MRKCIILTHTSIHLIRRNNKQSPSKKMFSVPGGGCIETHIITNTHARTQSHSLSNTQATWAKKGPKIRRVEAPTACCYRDSDRWRKSESQTSHSSCAGSISIKHLFVCLSVYAWFLTLLYIFMSCYAWVLDIRRAQALTQSHSHSLRKCNT